MSTPVKLLLILLFESVTAIIIGWPFMWSWNRFAPLGPLTYWQAVIIGYTIFFAYLKIVQVGALAYALIKGWWEDRS